MDNGHGQDNELMDAVKALVHDLDHDKTVVMEEGIRYNATCDGKNHYLYKMDKAAVNPKTGHGYSKGRIYVGTLEGNKERCPAYAANWQSKHSCRAGGVSDGHGRPEGHGVSGSESDAPIPAIGWPTAPPRR